MNTRSALNREATLSKLGNETFDLAIIGGGITGAGIALDAASRGMKVALVEQKDFSTAPAVNPPNSSMADCGISKTLRSAWSGK